MEGFLGEIRIWGSNRIPKYWNACSGQTLSISYYSDLFAIIGKRFGGDGITTFMLPNLQGRMVVGAGDGPALRPTPLASTGGVDVTAVTNANLASHTHKAVVKGGNAVSGLQQSFNDEGTELSPTGNYPAMSDANNYNSVVSQHTFLQPSSGTFGVHQTASENSGGNYGFLSYAPFQIVNYIICVQGYFPVRN